MTGNRETYAPSEDWTEHPGKRPQSIHAPSSIHPPKFPKDRPNRHPNRHPTDTPTGTPTATQQAPCWVLPWGFGVVRSASRRRNPGARATPGQMRSESLTSPGWSFSPSKKTGNYVARARPLHRGFLGFGAVWYCSPDAKTRDPGPQTEEQWAAQAKQRSDKKQTRANPGHNPPNSQIPPRGRTSPIPTGPRASSFFLV